MLFQYYIQKILMSRAPYQVLVLPYTITSDSLILYALFKRADADYWQGIAGGGEDSESPLEAARREAFEEAGIGMDKEFIKLDFLAYIPVVGVSGFLWGEDVLVIPEHCFGVRVEHERLTLSLEHSDYKWVDYDSAREMLHWDSNKNALWELNHRLTRD